MSRIQHCGGNRKCTLVFLKPSLETKDFYDFEVLIKAFCPKCKKEILEVAGFTYEQGLYPSHRIAYRKHEYWKEREITDFAFEKAANRADGKDTRALVFVGEYTIRISRGGRP